MQNLTKDFSYALWEIKIDYRGDADLALEIMRGVGDEIEKDRVTVPVRLEPSQTCRVDYGGTSWTARNVDATPIEAGREAVIASVDGLVLMVRASA